VPLLSSVSVHARCIVCECMLSVMLAHVHTFACPQAGECMHMRPIYTDTCICTVMYSSIMRTCHHRSCLRLVCCVLHGTLTRYYSSLILEFLSVVCCNFFIYFKYNRTRSVIRFYTFLWRCSVLVKPRRSSRFMISVAMTALTYVTWSMCSVFFYRCLAVKR